MLILLFWCREKERTVTFVLKERAEPLTEQSHLICFRKVLKYSPSCASLAQVGVSSVSVWRGPTQVCVTEMTSERESNALLSARGASMWVSYLRSCQGIFKLGSWPAQLACDHNRTQRRNMPCQPRNICITTVQSKCSVGPPEPFTGEQLWIQKMVWRFWL